MTAGRRYAHFECDRCHEPIGETGRVSIGQDEIVLATACPGCRRDGLRASLAAPTLAVERGSTDRPLPALTDHPGYDGDK